jgi:hypothetical protein
MKQILFIFIFIFGIISCSKIDNDTFSLVCETTSEWSGVINNVKGQEKKNETLTFIFKNKKLEGFECRVWTNDEISCNKTVGKVENNEGWSNHVVNFDRVSGKFTSSKSESEPKFQRFTNKYWIGKCEKVKDNKF